jgi:threonine dehydrogenase-like Zn-dependent dehydrogenase
VVRITHTTICGTDLHILKGDVPAVEDGRILGHEGVGVVEEVGDGVSNIRVGDEVVVEGPKAFGVGRAEMSGPEMAESTRGVAASVRHVDEQ